MHHYRLLQVSILLISINIITPVPVQLPRDNNLVELNYLMNENTLHWITVRSFEKKSQTGFRNAALKNGTSIRYWYSSEDVAYNSHTGTHLDAPCHFAKDAWCVDDIPIEHLMDLRLYILDVREAVKVNPDHQVTVADLQKLENRYWVKRGSVLFIATGWSSHWPIKEDYFGLDPDDRDAVMHFPGLSPEVADYIVEKGMFVGVGIEGPSIDPGSSVDKYAHRTLFANNIYAIENLPNMGGMSEINSRVTIAPLKVEAASASPVRIFVRNEPTATSAAPSHLSSPIICLAALCLLLSLLSSSHV